MTTDANLLLVANGIAVGACAVATGDGCISTVGDIETPFSILAHAANNVKARNTRDIRKSFIGMDFFIFNLCWLLGSSARVKEDYHAILL